MANDPTYSAGGAIYALSGNLQLINCIATNNSASCSGGGLYDKKATISITNCTFANNASPKGTAIAADSGSTSVVNSILWDNATPEIWGNSTTVSFSCVNGGAAGTSNIASNPLFNNAALPTGANGIFGDADDGLRLSAQSPCRDAGNDLTAPSNDLILINRPWGSHADIGAYEYEEYANQPSILGWLDHGSFVVDKKLEMIDKIYNWKYVRIFSKSNFARVFRIAVYRNDYTDKKNQIYAYIRGTDSNGNPLTADDVCIWFTRVGQDENNSYYQSQTSTFGKPILFVNEPSYHNWQNDWAYVLHVDQSASFSYRLPHNQFE